MGKNINPLLSAIDSWQNQSHKLKSLNCGHLRKKANLQFVKWQSILLQNFRRRPKVGVASAAAVAIFNDP